MAKVSIVIPVFNQLKMTINCLNDVINTIDTDLEIIVVDDGSSQPIVKAINKMFPGVKVLQNEINMGFAKTVNKGIKAATGEFIILLNNDIRIHNPRWVKMMLDAMSSYNLDLTAPAGGRMDNKWNYIPGEAKKRGDKFAYLVGWCLCVKRDVFNKIGYIPEDFGKGFFEDVLFGYRAKRAGLKADITEGLGVEHQYHATFKASGYNITKEYNEKRATFLEIIKEEK